MSKLTLLTILALYVGVVWFESSWPVIGGVQGARRPIVVPAVVQDTAGEERCGLLDRDVTPEQVGVNPASTQPDALQPLPLVRENTERSNDGRMADTAGIATSDSGRGVLGVQPAARLDGPGVMGLATYYHPSLAGEIMANGQPYNPLDAHIAASTDYPLGTVLTVSRVITVAVTDRGLLGPGHIDLSEAAFQQLAPLSVGVIKVRID